MTRNDTLLALARECRGSHQAALLIVGWWAAAAPDEDLEACLRLVREARGVLVVGNHLAAYAERWGRLPQPPG